MADIPSLIQKPHKGKTHMQNSPKHPTNKSLKPNTRKHKPKPPTKYMAHKNKIKIEEKKITYKHKIHLMKSPQTTPTNKKSKLIKAPRRRNSLPKDTQKEPAGREYKTHTKS